jgi:cytochrome c-type biogenesis protein CcmH/NrfF
MTVVGSYEFNLEDEYDPVGIPILAEMPWLLPVILILIILGIGIAVFMTRRRR